MKLLYINLVISTTVFNSTTGYFDSTYTIRFVIPAVCLILMLLKGP